MINILQLDATLGEIWGFSPLIIVRGHIQEIGIAALPLGLKPYHNGKVSRMSVDGRRRK